MNKTFEVRTEQIGQSALLQYKTWLLEHYAVRSANSMLVALNVFMTFAQWDCEKLKLMRTQSFGCDDQRYEMSVHDYHCLAAAARKAKNPQLELILETLVCTGIRVSELICFTVESIKKGSVSIRNKGKYRRIPLPDDLRKRLYYYACKNAIKSGPIFVTKNGKPKDRSNLWREMKKTT